MSSIGEILSMCGLHRPVDWISDLASGECSIPWAKESNQADSFLEIDDFLTKYKVADRDRIVIFLNRAYKKNQPNVDDPLGCRPNPVLHQKYPRRLQGRQRIHCNLCQRKRQSLGKCPGSYRWQYSRRSHQAQGDVHNRSVIRTHRVDIDGQSNANMVYHRRLTRLSNCTTT